MEIRKAEIGDIKKILDLLGDVLNIHAKIRPDIFIPNTTKYTESELKEIIENKNTPVYVAVSSSGEVTGYAFCQIEDHPKTNNTLPYKSLYLDDLCVDGNCRGQGIGKQLFNFVKTEARKLGCYEITLNVWEGNDNAKRFYENLGLKPKKTLMEYIIK